MQAGVPTGGQERSSGSAALGRIFAIPILHMGQVKPERVRSRLTDKEGGSSPGGGGEPAGPGDRRRAGRHAGGGGPSRAPHSPVDEVVFLQVLAAAGNVPCHVQEVQHGQGGGLVLRETEMPSGERRPGAEDLRHTFTCPQGGQTGLAVPWGPGPAALRSPAVLNRHRRLDLRPGGEPVTAGGYSVCGFHGTPGE